MTIKYNRLEIGKFLVIFGENQNECKYRISLNDKTVNEGICPSKLEAIKTAEDFISTYKKDMVLKRVDGIPTPQEFAEALSSIKPTGNQWEMLKAHYHAPNRKLTSSQLAEAVGFPNFSSANSQYGGLGSSIARHLEITPPGHYKDGKPLWITIITLENSESIENDTGHYQHILRNEVAEALEIVGGT